MQSAFKLYVCNFILRFFNARPSAVIRLFVDFLESPDFHIVSFFRFNILYFDACFICFDGDFAFSEF